MFFKLIGIVVAWFIVGTIINFLFYHDTPVEFRGMNENAKTVHIIVNIITVIYVLSVIFS